MNYFNNHKIAYVAVHLGFGRNPNNPLTNLPKAIKTTIEPYCNKELREAFSRTAEKILKKRGDYNTYLGNIRLFLEYMKQKRKRKSKDRPYFINVVEEWVYHSWLNYQRKLSIPKSDITIVTKDTKSKIINAFRGGKKIDSDSFHSFFEKEGITALTFVGENVWWDLSNDKPYKACLGITATTFSKRGFEIASVEGCIFPSERPTNLDDRIINILYSNAIPIPQPG